MNYFNDQASVLCLLIGAYDRLKSLLSRCPIMMSNVFLWTGSDFGYGVEGE